MVVSMEYLARSFGFHSFPPGLCDRRSQAQSVHSHPDLAELRCFDRDRTREEPRAGLTISRNESCICSWAPPWRGRLPDTASPVRTTERTGLLGILPVLPSP